MKRLLLALLLLLPSLLSAVPLQRVVVSAPGPRNLSYLPIDLIPLIGADRAEGLDVQLLPTGGGAVALSHLINRNADFSVAGLPAALSLRANGGDVVAVAAVNDRPMFVLMVRNELRGQVRRIADLRGRVLGVNTSTKQSKTTSQQLIELLLRSDGVDLDAVRIVPAGQSWVEQSSLMLSGAADAVMGDEPFASRLAAQDKVFFLANLSEPETVRHVPGSGFLHAALETRGDLLRDRPDTVRRMVAALRRSLDYVATHPAEEVVDRLGAAPEERPALIAALRRYPRAFSRDGAFSRAQLQETDRFFTGGATAPAASPSAEAVDSRFAGMRE